MSSLQVVEARRAFGSTSVLRGLSLSVNRGEFLVLLGPSGCGKSTLLHAMAGLEALDSGKVLIDGRDVTRVEPQHRGVSMVFQSYALYPTMSVRENLGFSLRMARMPKHEIEQRVMEAASMLQLVSLLDRRPAQLSGGQRQRVAIGRALTRRSAIVLLDEPLSNLDAQLRTDMRVELKRLHAQLGTTMIYVTHDQTEAMTLATRIALLNGGMVEQCDTPQALYDKPTNRFVASFLGSPRINLVPGELFDRGGVQLGIRPENLHLATAATPGAVEVQLVLREALGAETIVWCETGGQAPARLCMSLVPDVAAALGSSFFISADLHRACVFDPLSGLSLSYAKAISQPSLISTLS